MLIKLLQAYKHWPWALFVLWCGNYFSQRRLRLTPKAHPRVLLRTIFSLVHLAVKVTPCCHPRSCFAIRYRALDRERLFIIRLAGFECVLSSWPWDLHLCRANKHILTAIDWSISRTTDVTDKKCLSISFRTLLCMKCVQFVQLLDSTYVWFCSTRGTVYIKL